MDTKLFSRAQSGGFYIVHDREMHPSGNIFWVGSTVTAASNAAGFGLNPDAPFATLKYALSSDVCTASAGDVIYILPGHVEAITGATAATSPIMDIAGVKVIGLGSGALKPTFTITTAAAATFAITAANCWLENVKIVSNFLDIVCALSLAAGATGTMLKNLEFADTSTTKASLVQIGIEALCSDVTIDGLRVHLINVAGLSAAATNVILCAGAADRFMLRNSYIHCWTSAAAVSIRTGASRGVMIHDNFIVNEDTGAGLCIDLSATVSGGVFRNFVAGSKNNTQTIVFTGGICHYAENYGTDLVATSGIITPGTMTAWT